MEPKRWRRVEDLYHDALEREASKRSVFLAEACGGDEELRGEVESLLAQDIGDTGSLELPAWDDAEGLLELTGAGLVPGAKLGPYEVLGLLGVGGMGQVYRARDSRLGRSVAIKVAGRQFTGRFEREARAISALNHPHICTLYDVGPNYLVMELVEGQTLAAILRKGPLPLELVIRYGTQIADALATAHALGIFHRDLKPANIMVARNGVKVLDFGLAKITVPAGGAQPPETTLTDKRQIVGTPAYMAPEQLEGKPCDARTDLFALGLVLYEMATGKRAFAADSHAALIAQIMNPEPLPMETLPAQFTHVVERCVAREPGSRWQTASDLKLELIWVAQGVGAPPAAARAPSRSMVVFAIGLLLVAAALLSLFYYGRAGQPVQAVRSSLLPPSNWSFVHGGFSVSPDGTRLAFVAVGPDGVNRLWVRTFSGSGAQQLNGTEGAMLPFWAPDSRRIGFFAVGKLSTIDTGSGAVRILWEVPEGRCGGTWNRDGTIVFAPNIAGALFRISDTGGVAVPVTRLSREGSGQSHRWPLFLPDGKHFLYYVDWSAPDDSAGNGIYVGSLDASRPSKLVSSELAGNVAFAAGHLIYGHDRSLRMQPFDTDRLQLSGSALSIAEQELEQETRFFHSEFSVSQNGVLVFQSLADSESTLEWFDGKGKELGKIAGPGYSCPRISPDGRFVALSSDDARNGRLFIRVYDLARGIATRLTEVESDEDPAWSPDGKRITHGAFDGKQLHRLIDVRLDGSRPPIELLKGAKMVHLDWSRDEHLVFSDFSKGLPQLRVYSAADKQVTSFARGVEARFSPDGKWIAYYSAGGIFIQPFPAAGGRISAGYGAQPVWARDGRRIFYIAPDKKLMAVSFDPQDKSAGAPRELFQTRIIAPNIIGTQYDVSVDGRFLINSVPANHSSPLTLLTGWTAQLKR